MTDSDRDGLIARIRQARRLAPAREQPRDLTEALPQDDQLRALQARVAHVERLLEGLQDSVHRESERHAKMIAELQAQVEPGAMGASLADDARQRGL